MHDTLSSLVERAVTGNQRPLEFYLREHSRLPGAQANLKLLDDVSGLIAAIAPQHPDGVRSLLNYFVNGDHKMPVGNTPAEFVIMCGIAASGACVAKRSEWYEPTLIMLSHYAHSGFRRVRDSVVMAYQHLLTAYQSRTLSHLMDLAAHGDYLQQCAAISTVAEPRFLYEPEMSASALQLQRIVLERFHNTPGSERKQEDFKALRRALGYTLSVVTAAAPASGFALMRECAAWNDSDIAWVLRENLKKKRLAKYASDAQTVSNLLTPRRGSVDIL